MDDETHRFFADVAKGNIAGVRMMLALNKHLLKRWNFDRERPIHVAARYGRNDVIDVLLAAGEDINICSKGRSALNIAITAKKNGTAQLLIARGIDVNIGISGSGNTTLCMSVIRNDMPLCLLLLENGANAAVKSCRNTYPYKVAEYYGQYEMALVLKNAARNSDRCRLSLQMICYIKCINLKLSMADVPPYIREHCRLTLLAFQHSHTLSDLCCAQNFLSDQQYKRLRRA